MKRVLRFNPQEIVREPRMADDRLRGLFKNIASSHGMSEFFYALTEGEFLPIGIRVIFKIENSTTQVVLQTIPGQTFHPKTDTALIPLRLLDWSGWEDKHEQLMVKWFQEKWVTKYPED